MSTTLRHEKKRLYAGTNDGREQLDVQRQTGSFCIATPALRAQRPQMHSPKSTVFRQFANLAAPCSSSGFDQPDSFDGDDQSTPLNSYHARTHGAVVGTAKFFRCTCVYEYRPSDLSRRLCWSGRLLERLCLDHQRATCRRDVLLQRTECIGRDSRQAREGSGEHNNAGNGRATAKRPAHLSCKIHSHDLGARLSTSRGADRIESESVGAGKCCLPARRPGRFGSRQCHRSGVGSEAVDVLSRPDADHDGQQRAARRGTCAASIRGATSIIPGSSTSNSTNLSTSSGSTNISASGSARFLPCIAATPPGRRVDPRRQVVRRPASSLSAVQQSRLVKSSSFDDALLASFF